MICSIQTSARLESASFVDGRFLYATPITLLARLEKTKIAKIDINCRYFLTTAHIEAVPDCMLPSSSSVGI